MNRHSLFKGTILLQAVAIGIFKPLEFFKKIHTMIPSM